MPSFIALLYNIRLVLTCLVGLVWRDRDSLTSHMPYACVRERTGILMKWKGKKYVNHYSNAKSSQKATKNVRKNHQHHQEYCKASMVNAKRSPGIWIRLQRSERNSRTSGKESKTFIHIPVPDDYSDLRFSSNEVTAFPGRFFSFYNHLKSYYYSLSAWERCVCVYVYWSTCFNQKPRVCNLVCLYLFICLLLPKRCTSRRPSACYNG